MASRGLPYNLRKQETRFIRANSVAHAARKRGASESKSNFDRAKLINDSAKRPQADDEVVVNDQGSDIEDGEKRIEVLLCQNALGIKPKVKETVGDMRREEA